MVNQEVRRLTVTADERLRVEWAGTCLDFAEWLQPDVRPFGTVHEGDFWMLTGPPTPCGA